MQALLYRWVRSNVWQFCHRNFILVVVLSPTVRYQPRGACPECGPSHSQRGRWCDNEVGPAEHRLSWVAEEVRAGSGSADGASGGGGPARWAAETGWNGEGGMGACWWSADRIAAREHWQSQGETDKWTCWLSFALHEHFNKVAIGI